MAIESNAKTAAQKKLVQDYAASLGDDADFTDGKINFASKGQGVTLAIDGEDQQGFASYKEFRAFISGEQPEEQVEDPENPSNFEPWSEIARVQLGQLGEDPEGVDDDDLRPYHKGGKTPKEAAEAVARQREAIRAKEKADAEERARKEKIIREATAEVEAEVAELASVIRGERSGDLAKNEARYAKGERLVRLEDLAQRLKEAGDKRFGSNRAVLQFAREQVREAIGAAGILDTALDKRLSDQEASATRTVYRTYMNEGMSTKFRLVDTINPETGELYQDDLGNPPEMPITGIALNKLYIMAPYFNPEGGDEIISFAHRTGEKALSAAKKLMDKELDNAVEVIREIDSWLDSNPTNESGQPYNSTDEAIIDFVAHKQGKRAPSQVKTIKVDAAFFDGAWREVKAIATALYKRFGIMLDDKEEAGSTQILERVFSTAFSEFEESEEGRVRAVANLFVNAEDITEAQAEEFFDAYFAPEESEGDAEAASDQEPVEA